jgi:Dimethlysulfonioproprionate lyase
LKTLSRRQFAALGTGTLATAMYLSPVVDTLADERANMSGRNPASSEANANVNDLIEQTHAFLVALNAPVLDPFLAEWPRSREHRPVEAVSVSVVRWLPQAKTDAAAAAVPLVAELARVAPSLAWHQTYKQPTVSAAFLANYGYTELAGLTGPVPSQRLACGFLLLGPATSYPRHRHEAEEIYVPLSGTAAWQHGNQPWQDEVPGPDTVIHHVSDEPHAMKTHRQPMLALYLWRSHDLNQKSRLDPVAAT